MRKLNNMFMTDSDVQRSRKIGNKIAEAIRAGRHKAPVRHTFDHAGCGSRLNPDWLDNARFIIYNTYAIKR